MFQVKSNNQQEWQNTDEVSVRANLAAFFCSDNENWQATHHDDTMRVNQAVRDMRQGQVVTVDSHSFRFNKQED